MRRFYAGAPSRIDLPDQTVTSRFNNYLFIGEAASVGIRYRLEPDTAPFLQ